MCQGLKDVVQQSVCFLSAGVVLAQSHDEGVEAEIKTNIHKVWFRSCDTRTTWMLNVSFKNSLRTNR